MRRSMRSKTTGAVLITGFVLLAAGVAEAQNAGPPTNPPGQNSFIPPGLVNNPGLANANANASRVQSVPVSATTLILFGAGLLAMPWLRARRAK